MCIRDRPWNMRLAMWIMSFLCILIGIVPALIYGILPYAIDYEPYTVDHIVTQLQLLLFAGFAFFALLALMKRTLTISLDFDWFYRKLLFGLFNWLKEFGPKLTTPAVLGFKSFGIKKFENLYKVHGPQGILARTWPSANMVLWVAIILAVAMILHFTKR